MEEIDQPFLHLLQNLKGCGFYKVLKDHAITEESLKYMTPQHLNVIIPKAEYGPRIIFEFHLKKWQQEQVPIEDLSSCNGTTLTLPKLNNVDDFGGLNETSLEQILMRSLNGQNVLKYYSTKKSLDNRFRRLLSSTITGYLLETETQTSPKLFEKIANAITRLFVNESKDIYYIQKKGRKPGGCLYQTYHNSLAKLRSQGLWSVAVPAESSVLSTLDISASGAPDENDIATKEWLKFNNEPIEEVMKKWSTTFSLRKTFIKGNHSLFEILHEWPLLKQSFGYKLILADFLQIYPGKENLLFEKWEVFCISMEKLVQKSSKNPETLDQLAKLKKLSLDSEHRASIILYLLHEVLKPSVRKCVIDKDTNKRKFYKATVADSRNALVIWAPTICELQTKIKYKIDELYKCNSTLQPTVIFTDESVDEFLSILCRLSFL